MSFGHAHAKVLRATLSVPYREIKIRFYSSNWDLANPQPVLVEDNLFLTTPHLPIYTSPLNG